MRSARLLVTALIFAVAVSAWTAAPAAAHARLEESAPAVGEVLAASPAEVAITFTQDVQKLTGTYGIVVTGADSVDYAAAPAVLDDADRTRMSVTLRPLPPGRYVVTYRNVSDVDGDTSAGAYAFYVGVQPGAADLAADAELAQDEEETPAPTNTAAPPTIAPAASATPVPDRGEDDGDDGGRDTVTRIAIVAGAVAAGIMVGFLGWRAFGRRRT